MKKKSCFLTGFLCLVWMLRTVSSVAAAPAAPSGESGGAIWIAAARDGSKIAEYELNTPVVWDGMAGAKGRLYVSMMDGSVLCLTSNS